MLLTLILASLAGWAVRPAEARIAEALAGVLGEERLQTPADRRGASLILCLLGAALLLWLLDARGGVLLFSLGAALGYFLDDLREAILRRQS